MQLRPSLPPTPTSYTCNLAPIDPLPHTAKTKTIHASLSWHASRPVSLFHCPPIPPEICEICFFIAGTVLSCALGALRGKISIYLRTCYILHITVGTIYQTFSRKPFGENCLYGTTLVLKIPAKVMTTQQPDPIWTLAVKLIYSTRISGMVDSSRELFINAYCSIITRGCSRSPRLTLRLSIWSPLEIVSKQI